MRLHKVRVIQSGGGTVTGGVSLPQEVFVKWQNILVTIIESGNCLILQSGTTPQPITNTQLRQLSVETSFIRI